MYEWRPWSTRPAILHSISVTDFFLSDLRSLLLFAHAPDFCRTNGHVPPREWRKFYKRGPSEVQFALFYYLTEHGNILTEQIDQVCPFTSQARNTNNVISFSKIIDNVEWMLKKLYVYMELNTYRKQYTEFYNLKIWKYEYIFQ